jgi:hypothetical protein
MTCNEQDSLVGVRSRIIVGSRDSCFLMTYVRRAFPILGRYFSLRRLATPKSLTFSPARIPNSFGISAPLPKVPCSRVVKRFSGASGRPADLQQKGSLMAQPLIGPQRPQGVPHDASPLGRRVGRLFAPAGRESMHNSDLFGHLGGSTKEQFEGNTTRTH